MKKNTIKIVQDPEAPIAVEVIAESIKAISEGIKILRNSPLNERALILLITNATPKVGKGYRAKHLSPKMIGAVLDGIESLESEYLKPNS